MARTVYSPQFKTRFLLGVLKGEKELGTIACEKGITPNMLRNWKREFVDNASTVFENPKKAEKQAERNEENLKKDRPNAEDHRTADAGTGLSSGLLSPVRAVRP